MLKVSVIRSLILCIYLKIGGLSIHIFTQDIQIVEGHHYVCLRLLKDFYCFYLFNGFFLWTCLSDLKKMFSVVMTRTIPHFL